MEFVTVLFINLYFYLIVACCHPCFNCLETCENNYLAKFLTGDTQVYDPKNVGDPQNAGLGSGTSRQQNSHVEVNALLSA